MNLFFLRPLVRPSDLVRMAAMYHPKHQKIILEIAQMLSAAVHVNLPDHADAVYRPSHRNHPMTLWITASPYNALLAIRIAHALDTRFLPHRKSGQRHASMAVVDTVAGLLSRHWDAMYNSAALERLHTQTTATLCAVHDWMLPVTPIPACVGQAVDAGVDLITHYTAYYRTKLEAWEAAAQASRLETAEAEATDGSSVVRST